MLTVIETPEFIASAAKIWADAERVDVIYFTHLAGGELVLLLVYAKAKFDNLRPEFLLKLKEKFDEQANH